MKVEAEGPKTRVDMHPSGFYISPVDMKKNSSVTVLLTLLVISVLLSLGLYWLSITKERELRDLRTAAANVNSRRTLLGLLAKDAAEYSKKNPAIDPILESVGVKQPKAGAAKPAAK